MLSLDKRHHYPPFIKKHKVFEKFPKVNKVFAKIGLKNEKQDLDRHSIVFTYKPWDIATMSMRGIHSCQGWKGSRRAGLIGSMVDPFCAIIFATDRTKVYSDAFDGVKRIKQVLLGEKMLARAVVRLVLDKDGKEASLMLEPVYGVGVAKWQELFRAFLEERSGLKVIYGQKWCWGARPRPKEFVPSSDAVRSLACATRSFRDSGILYRDAGMPKGLFK